MSSLRYAPSPIAARTRAQHAVEALNAMRSNNHTATPEQDMVIRLNRQQGSAQRPKLRTKPPTSPECAVTPLPARLSPMSKRAWNLGGFSGCTGSLPIRPARSPPAPPRPSVLPRCDECRELGRAEHSRDQVSALSRCGRARCPRRRGFPARGDRHRRGRGLRCQQAEPAVITRSRWPLASVGTSASAGCAQAPWSRAPAACRRVSEVTAANA